VKKPCSTSCYIIWWSTQTPTSNVQLFCIVGNKTKHLIPSTPSTKLQLFVFYRLEKPCRMVRNAIYVRLCEGTMVSLRGFPHCKPLVWPCKCDPRRQRPPRPEASRGGCRRRRPRRKQGEREWQKTSGFTWCQLNIVEPTLVFRKHTHRYIYIYVYLHTHIYTSWRY
jgi:hypothetical protein